MPREILDDVLPFAERVIGRRIQHTSPMLNGVVVMAIDVFHPHHYGLGVFANRPALFSYNYRAVADVQLCAMIGYSQT